MQQYKHYSFDFWLTLVKSDPVYKQKVAEYFHEHFNRDKKTVDEVRNIIREIDIMCNTINEKTGGNFDAFEMYAMVLYRLNYDFKSVQLRDLQSIYYMTDQLFLNNPPEFYDNDTIKVLKELKQRGATISILSNTAFVKGFTLKRFLKNNGLDNNIFDFQLYSDECGMSKPNEQLFRNMIKLVHAFRAHHPVLDSEIVHIGDNILADIEGAKKVGIDSIQINSNDKTIKDIL